MSVKGRSVLVTGGTGALGAVLVRKLFDEGAKLCISYRDVKDLGRLPQPLRNTILPVLADVTTESVVMALFDEAGRKNGPVEILVNGVGGFLPRTNIVDLTVDQWKKMMDMNLTSTFLCTREALRRMKGRSFGRIINISAMAGLRPSPGRAAYAISKSAVALFTELAAQEHKGSGITINAIAPSIIDTEANRTSMPDEDYGKWVKPESIADAVCYLCSDAGADITGTIIKAYGGV
jgi:NAD(P)-dependent dehydrogenase (short-subunit alcohol dehydrogenase family)